MPHNPIPTVVMTLLNCAYQKKKAGVAFKKNEQVTILLNNVYFVITARIFYYLTRFCFLLFNFCIILLNKFLYLTIFVVKLRNLPSVKLRFKYVVRNIFRC